MIALFAHARDTRPRPRRVSTLADLAALLTRASEATPHPDPWARMGEDSWRAAKTSLPAWSPASYPEGAQRGNANVREVAFAVADLDDVPAREFERVATGLRERGLGYVMHDTPSANRAHAGLLRRRLVVGLLSPVPGPEWASRWGSIMADLGFATTTDRAARDAARIYFVPIGAARVELVDGDAYDWAERAAIQAERPAPAPAPRPAPERWADDVEARARRALAYVERCDPAVAGQRGHDATMRVAVAVVRGFALPRAVAREILSWYSDRCDPPWSEIEIEHKLESAERASRVGWGYLLERGAA